MATISGIFMRPLAPALVFLALVFSMDIEADARTERPTTAAGSGGAFDLHLVREDLTVEYRDSSAGGDFELTRIGVAFHEYLSETIRGGVAIGATGIRQRDRPATSEVDPTGWSFGLDFEQIWPREARLRLNTGISWRFTRADRSDDDGNETILDWHTAEARTGLVTRLTPAVAVRVGAAYKWVRGDERFRGDESTTTRFHLDDPLSGFVQLDFRTSREGVIRFHARGGNPTGARILFEYNY